MSGWFDRWQQRQRELQDGADADLIRANRKRWNLAWGLWACFFVLLGLQMMVKLPALWHSFVLWLSGAFFIGGSVLSRWAQAESAFLNRPGPKEQPRLWK